MELKEFIQNVANQFEEAEMPNVNEHVNFKLLDTWDSLTAFSIQMMIEDEYRVKVTNDELKSAVTLADLFELVKVRHKSL